MMHMVKKTLLVDGTWNLKRNFYKRESLLNSRGSLCGGTYGFIDSLRSVVNRTMPDRVVVFWDGFHAGKLRYNEFPFYKKSREKDWKNEERIIASEGIGDAEDTRKFELFKQKMEVQRYLDELFVRQIEVDYVEADDLLAYYIIKKPASENAIIYSRDRDFLQLVSDSVSIITPDSMEVINPSNFKEKIGYTHENALLIKCFTGDDSDDIDGVQGIGEETLFKHFPLLREEKYTFQRLVDEGSLIQEQRVSSKPKKKPLAKINKIMDSSNVLYRNAKLMNLKSPYINMEGINEVVTILNNSLDEERSIEDAMQMFSSDGFMNISGSADLSVFFAPFYSLKTKELEFSRKNN